jgi:hypothetical protein
MATEQFSKLSAALEAELQELLQLAKEVHNEAAVVGGQEDLIYAIRCLTDAVQIVRQSLARNQEYQRMGKEIRRKRGH